MFRLWCEWDCGQDELLFNSEEDAKLFLKLYFHEESKAEGHNVLYSMDFHSVDEIFEQGLASCQKLTVWQP
jgi:hypothetical protein